jgi:hypothetical protein
MPVERAADHPRFELGGTTVTSLAAPSRGANEVIVTMLPGNQMFRDDGSVSVPPWVQ